MKTNRLKKGVLPALRKKLKKDGIYAHSPKLGIPVRTMQRILATGKASEVNESIITKYVGL